MPPANRLAGLTLTSTLCVLLAVPVMAAAQDEPPPAFSGDYEPPIGLVVVDVRGSFTRFGENPLLASNLGVRSLDLATSGRGFDLGVHVYPFRWRAITFGVGASYQFSQGERQTQADPDAGIPLGPRVRTRLNGVVPQVSLNFGTGEGWSYLSGGLSPARLDIQVSGVDRQTRTTKTINYGGGARWFTSNHLALNFDVRFYAMNPLPEEGDLIATPRMTLIAVSVGASFK